MFSPSFLSNDTVAMTDTDLDGDWLSFAGAQSDEAPSASVPQGPMVFGHYAAPSHQLTPSPGVTGVSDGIQTIPVSRSTPETKNPINYMFDGGLDYPLTGFNFH